MSDPHTETQSGGGPMGALIAWMAKNSVASNLFMFAILAGGALGLMRIKQEVFPEFSLDVISVSVPYPGASPTEVEQGIILAIEEQARGLDGVKRVTSTSAEGVGTVSIQTLLGEDPNKVLGDVKNAVDRITSFPADAEEPQVALANNRNQVVSLVLSGDVSRQTLYELGEKMRGDLLAAGLTQVDISGLPPLEVRIEVPRDNLEAYGLTLDQIAQLIRASSLELPGGGVKTANGEILVRVSDRAMTGEEFRDIILRGTPLGATVRLGDIAQIYDDFADTTKEAYLDSLPAVRITTYRVGNETPEGVATVVKDYASQFEAGLPAGMNLVIWDDDSELLRGRIDLLVRNALSGIVLVFIVLWFFLDLRLAYWVGLGIPISFMGAFLLLPLAGGSINMISLFALIITLGMVVDDAIVVGENVFEKAQAGLSPMKAAIEGAQEMSVPVTFAILTSVAAFAPMLAVPGVSGKIFAVIPTVVVSVLIFSLLESFFVLPAHLGHGGSIAIPGGITLFLFLLLGPALGVTDQLMMIAPFVIAMVPLFLGIERVLGLRPAPPELHTMGQRFLDAVDAPRRVMSGALERFIERVYTPTLDVLLEWRYATLGASLGLLIATFGLMASGVLPFKFFPALEGDVVKVSARLPYGAPVARTREIGQMLEQSLQQTIQDLDATAIVEGTYLVVGEGPRGGGPGGGSTPSGTHLLSLEVQLIPAEDRELTTAVFQDAWEDNTPRIAGIESISFASSIGPSAGADVDIQLTHPDVSVLAAVSTEITETLRSYSDLVGIDNSYANGKPQLNFELTEAGRTLGLTTNDIARQLRAGFYGAEALREQRGRNEIKVMVRLPPEERKSEYDLSQIDIRTPTGGSVPLEQVAVVTRTRAPTEIVREDAQRIVNVRATLKPGVESSRKVLEDLEANVFPALRAANAGLDIDLAGEERDRNESLSSLGGNYAFALFAIYALLAIPFRSYSQPLIIMSVIPFGVIGAALGHVAMGYSLSIISVMGIIALSGVVINDSLVLVDAANQRLALGEGEREAIRWAGARRLRPILLTSLTTFFGLLPMIFEPSVQARFLIPMAISLGYGVLFATFIVLLVVPCLYMVLDDATGLFRRLRKAIANLYEDEVRIEESNPAK